MMNQDFLSGFIAIIGSPNVGKSTLLNALVGQKVAIVSDKAQTTRNQIRGILTRDQYQMVFIDTPGIQKPKNRLGDYMEKVAFAAFNEVEAVLFVLDPTNGFREKDKQVAQQLKKAKAPVIAVINKIDIAVEPQMAAMREQLENETWLAGICEVSAQTGFGVTDLEERLCQYLEKGPQYFPEDMVTDQAERVICAEMIRESALQLLHDEVPHGIGVEIDKMSVREDRDITDIWATIYCDRESHKRIIIGKKGAMLKEIGLSARKQIEWLLGQQVNLQLWIKVHEGWRDKMGDLRMFGYYDKK